MYMRSSWLGLQTLLLTCEASFWAPQIEVNVEQNVRAYLT